LKDGKDLRNMDIYYALETLRTVQAFEIKQKRSRERQELLWLRVLKKRVSKSI
jgi:aspartate ammonia-lyase